MENLNNEKRAQNLDALVVERKLVDILLSVGIPAHLQGYQFLKASIKLVMENPRYISSITKIMYPTVATKFKTTACRVERAIRHALEVSYNKGKITNLNEMFGLKLFEENEKPTNSEFVALVADRLALDMK